jgi:hypothetical protein
MTKFPSSTVSSRQKLPNLHFARRTAESDRPNAEPDPRRSNSTRILAAYSASACPG